MQTTDIQKDLAAWLKDAEEAEATIAVVYQQDGSRGLSVGFPLYAKNEISARAARLVESLEADPRGFANFIEAHRPDLVLRAPQVASVAA